MALPTLFEMVAGDDRVIRLHIKNQQGAAVSLWSYAFQATLKESLEDSDDDAPVRIDTVAQSRPTGMVYLYFNAEDTKNLKPRKYFFDVQAATNGRVSTLFRGMVKILPQVTQRQAGGAYDGVIY